MADVSTETRKLRDSQIRAAVNQKLVESGEKEKLKDLLRAKLVECGWRDEMKAYCKEVIKTRGIDNITVDELVSEITPKGRSSVPTQVKAELLQRLRKFITSTTTTKPQ